MNTIMRCLSCLLAASTSVVLAEPIAFDWFEYRGRDAAFEAALPAGAYRNPVLAGFHPDPSVVRARDRFYLVNSSFAFFPGIPIFESADLVHWQQIGNAIERPSQLDFDGLGISRGVFAPTIEYHDGVFYVVNTAVDNGGNFYVTATDPAGPWSDPIWLKDVDGIDPSLFFDDTDGKVYLLNNGPPEGEPLYDGHRAIWMQAFDLVARKPFGPRRVLLNGGVDLSKKPIWIEGPHLYRRDGWYYLVCAEGGTGPQHSQVVLRSRDVWGPYTPFEGNPILTQRDLDPARRLPITNAGHADLVEGPDGRWWAIFLASRNYGGTHYNTGRETFLLPVEWKDGWPRILEAGREIPYIAQGPSYIDRSATQAPLTGNFTWRDEFDGAPRDRAWMFVRVPKTDWARLDAPAGVLVIEPLAEGLETLKNPSFLARRQQHIDFEASTALSVPKRAGTAAGIAAYQNQDHWYFFGVRHVGEEIELFLEKRSRGATAIIARRSIAAVSTLKLRISGREGRYGFAYAERGDWQPLREDDDASILSTDVAGGFVGAVLGPYARIEPTP